MFPNFTSETDILQDDVNQTSTNPVTGGGGVTTSPFDLTEWGKLAKDIGGIFTGKTGGPLGQLAAFGGVAALLNQLAGDQKQQPIGYQGGIPQLVASREQMPYTSGAQNELLRIRQAAQDAMSTGATQDQVREAAMRTYGISPAQFDQAMKTEGTYRRPGQGGITYFTPIKYTATGKDLGPMTAGQVSGGWADDQVANAIRTSLQQGFKAEDVLARAAQLGATPDQLSRARTALQESGMLGGAAAPAATAPTVTPTTPPGGIAAVGEDIKRRAASASQNDMRALGEAAVNAIRGGQSLESVVKTAEEKLGIPAETVRQAIAAQGVKVESGAMPSVSSLPTGSTLQALRNQGNKYEAFRGLDNAMMLQRLYGPTLVAPTETVGKRRQEFGELLPESGRITSATEQADQIAIDNIAKAMSELQYFQSAGKKDMADMYRRQLGGILSQYAPLYYSEDQMLGKFDSGTDPMMLARLENELEQENRLYRGKSRADAIAEAQQELDFFKQQYESEIGKPKTADNLTKPGDFDPNAVNYAKVQLDNALQRLERLQSSKGDTAQKIAELRSKLGGDLTLDRVRKQFGIPVPGAAAGGKMQGGIAMLAKGRYLKGNGDGVSDDIPAEFVGSGQPAALADGEFVIPARVVAEIGNGSSDAGARKLYAMLDRVEARARKAKRGKPSGADRELKKLA